jgi:hypothetical protein
VLSHSVVIWFSSLLNSVCCRLYSYGIWYSLKLRYGLPSRLADRLEINFIFLSIIFHKWETRYVCRNLTGKPETERPRRGGRNNMKMNYREMWCESVDWLRLSQVIGQSFGSYKQSGIFWPAEGPLEFEEGLPHRVGQLVIHMGEVRLQKVFESQKLPINIASWWRTGLHAMGEKEIFTHLFLSLPYQFLILEVPKMSATVSPPLDWVTNTSIKTLDSIQER